MRPRKSLRMAVFRCRKPVERLFQREHSRERGDLRAKSLIRQEGYQRRVRRSSLTEALRAPAGRLELDPTPRSAPPPFTPIPCAEDRAAGSFLQ